VVAECIWQHSDLFKPHTAYTDVLQASKPEALMVSEPKTLFHFGEQYRSKDTADGACQRVRHSTALSEPRGDRSKKTIWRRASRPIEIRRFFWPASVKLSP